MFWVWMFGILVFIVWIGRVGLSLGVVIYYKLVLVFGEDEEYFINGIRYLKFYWVGYEIFIIFF